MHRVGRVDLGTHRVARVDLDDILVGWTAKKTRSEF